MTKQGEKTSEKEARIRSVSRDFPPCGGLGSVIEGIRPLEDHMPRTHRVSHTVQKQRTPEGGRERRARIREWSRQRDKVGASLPLEK